MSSQISPFPDGYRNIASGFLEGYVGYASVPGFLGGGVADLFTLLVGALAVAGFAVSQVRIRRARQRYRQPVPSTPAFVLKLVLVGVVITAFMAQLSKYSGTPVILIIVAVLALGFAVVTNRSVFGRHIYSIGGNLHAAELSGVKTKAVTFWVFVIMGVLSALAGIVFAARINLANPTNGNGFELDAIAAAFIGGAAVTGGVGRVVGAVVGGTIMAVLNNGMSIMGIDVSYQQVIKGAVLLAAVAFDVYNKRKVRV